MWSLYLVEEHDIVLYYETADDTSHGLRYMQKLCDAERGEHDGALSLIKIVEQTPPYIAVLQQCTLIEHPTEGVSNYYSACFPPSPQRDPLLRPPCRYNLA